jgi:hypothetical protein
MGMKGCSLYKVVFRIMESRGRWTRYVACIAKDESKFWIENLEKKSREITAQHMFLYDDAIML